MDNVQIIERNGIKVVEINSIEFSSKRKIDWNGVEQYLKKYVGKQFVIEETGDIIHIGSDFPDEYANSRDSIKSFGMNGKAKANAVQAIPELVQVLNNIVFQQNLEPKHQIDAPNGWYRGTVRFTLPIKDERGNTVGKNSFRGRMVIRSNKHNKLYLYDIVNIKKET